MNTPTKDPATGKMYLRIDDHATGVTVDLDGKGNVLRIIDPNTQSKPPLNKSNPTRACPQAQGLTPEAGPQVLLPRSRPANFESFGIKDTKTNEPITWERLNKALETKSNEAYFWSGRINDVGVENMAGEYAKRQGATTLEGLLEKNGVKLPEWRTSPEAWAETSKVYAERASGTVKVFLGEDHRSRSIWETIEKPALLANPKVSKIIAVDGRTKVERIIFERREASQ